VIAHALARAGIGATDVRYIEMHGTGTQLGDPIEFRAMANVYGAEPDRLVRCHLGSLKSSYGHLDAAAGIVGLIKSMLVVRGGWVYPQTNFTAPNPLVDLAGTRFEITVAPREFPAGARAAVSALGLGGTNCHVILRGARPSEQTDSPNGRQPGDVVDVEVGARSPASAARLGTRLATYLRRHPRIRPVDVAATLARRNVADMTYRLWVRGHDELVSALETLGTGAADGVVPSPAGTRPTGNPTGNRIWLPPTPLDEAAIPPEQVVQTVRAVPVISTAPAPATAGGGRASVHELCLRFMSDELGTPVEEGTDFFAAGGESIALVEVVGRLTTEHDFVADFGRLDALTNAGAIAAELERQATAAAVRVDPVIEFGPPSPVYWHPPAGGTNFCYAALQRLCPTVGFNAFRMAPDDGASSIEDIAARNIRTLNDRRALSDRLILGGYSLGGDVGLEMAFQLERAGIRPRLLVLFDSRPPTAYRGTDKGDNDYDEGILMLIRQGARGAQQSGTADCLTEFSRLIEDGGSSAGVLYQDFAQTWRNNQQALTAYKPGGVLSCPIVIFSAAQPLLPEEHKLGIEDLPPTEWQRYSSVPLEVITVPGDHYSMFVDPDCLRVVADQLPAVLKRGGLQACA
jgi:thioesterase domain-containing protein